MGLIFMNKGQFLSPLLYVLVGSPENLKCPKKRDHLKAEQIVKQYEGLEDAQLIRQLQPPILEHMRSSQSNDPGKKSAG